MELIRGHATGKVVRVCTEDEEFMGQTRRCSEDEPQFEVESDESGDHAMHYADALQRVD